MKIYIGYSPNAIVNNQLNKSNIELFSTLLQKNDLVFNTYNNDLIEILNLIASTNQNKIIILNNQEKQNSNTNNIIEIINKSEALVFTPGGYDVMHDFFSAIEYKKSQQLDTPIILYNDQSVNYYACLEHQLMLMSDYNIISETEENLYSVAFTPNDVLKKINNYQRIKS